MRMRRGAVLAGATCLALALVGTVNDVGGARADDGPGTGFLAYSVTATAPGTQVTEDRLAASLHPEAEGEVPLSLAQLLTGPQGYGLSSIAWPGPLVGNAGATSQLLNLGLPPSTADSLNDPVRAEARTGSGPPKVTNSSYPGTTMSASAAPDDIEASATMAGTGGPSPQSDTGATETASSARLTGPTTAQATARSTVRKVSLAAGVVTIGSVISSATATTNGSKAAASGGTTVFDLQVGGQPAYLDQTGLHLGTTGPGVPVNAIAASLAQQALSGTGMKVAVSQPVTQTDGGQVHFTAGTVVFFWAPPNSQGQTFTAAFGGAAVTAAATPGSHGAVASGGGAAPDQTPSAGQAPNLAPAPVHSSFAASPPSAPTNPPGSLRSPADRPGTVTLGPRLVAAPLRLPRGLAPALPILVLIGSGLIAFGLRRLPDRVLEPSATTCPLGGRT